MSKAGRSVRATSSTRIWRQSGWTSKIDARQKNDVEREDSMGPAARLAAAGLIAALSFAGTAAAETPKRGGILTYMIPADAPPRFDGHRESTFATVHGFA